MALIALTAGPACAAAPPTFATAIAAPAAQAPTDQTPEVGSIGPATPTSPEASPTDQTLDTFGPSAPGDQNLDLKNVGAPVAETSPDAPPGHRLLHGRATYAGLPEPAGWLLMLFGVAMIGAALRGFVMANRALAKLQPEDQD